MVGRFSAVAVRAADRPVVNIGVVSDGPYEGNPYSWDLTGKEILALTEDEFDVRFPEEDFIESDWSLKAPSSHLTKPGTRAPVRALDPVY